MIASITKTYTATLAMTLVQQGLLDLERPARYYLPELLDCPADTREQRSQVRVQDLFTHSAGWASEISFDTGRGDDALTRLVRDMLPTVEQSSPPGAYASYNNLSPAVAARLIEVIGGGTFEDLMRARVLDPLRLSTTFLFPDDVANRRHAVGHRDTAEGLVPVDDWPIPRCFTPSGGIASSIRDLLAWAQFHLAGETPGLAPIDPARRAAMRVPHFTMTPSMSVGLSWFLRQRAGKALVSHDGSMNSNQMSTLALVPEADLAVSTLANAPGGGDLGRIIIDWALERIVGVKLSPLPVTDPPEDLSEINGRYAKGHTTVAVEAVGSDILITTESSPDYDHELPTVRAHFIGQDAFATDIDPYEAAGMIVRNASGSIAAVAWQKEILHRTPTP
ncbi:MAG: hypothetical protein BGO26_00865 [Actinobacteria bacterium 69-20]|nr:MAG: hypothetical protein BGO26_00865 [Actinobacteria bacterium 69-20]